MTALPYETPQFPPELPFVDQRGGMKAMGIILIVLGGFTGCLGLITIPIMLATSQMQMPTTAPAAGQPPAVMPRVADVVTGVLIYIGAAALLISVGVGSLRVRRWSRAAALVLTGSWSLAGLLTLVSFIVMAPGMRRAMAIAASAPPPGGGAPPPAAAVATVQNAGLVMALLFILLLGVLLPAGLFLFYRRASVQKTLDYFAPGDAWTDRCPTPVLAACAWLAFGALMSLALSAKGVAPVFGTLLTGPLATAVVVGVAILNAVLAVGIYRLRPLAWWATLAATAIGLASVLVTFARVDPFEVQRLSGTPPEQIELLRQAGVNVRLTTLLPPILYGGLALGYLSWIGRYFTRADRSAPS